MYYRILYEQLIFWKEKKDRKPLILRGARQVGKTTLVEMFSNEFDHFINLNLDLSEDREIFEQSDNIDRIIQFIFLKEGISKSSRNILVFIDEIQNSPNAIKLLRYFYEKANYLYVIAAGSLLESLIDNQISFPVGRVEYLVLRPFSFKEYLIASEEQMSLELIGTIPFPNYGHQKLLELFKEYTLIGGIPDVVKTYLQNRDLVLTSNIFQNLITTYLDDVEKYGRNEKNTQIIRHVIQSSLQLSGSRIKFEGFGDSNYKSKDIGEALRTLQKTLLISLNYPTTNIKLPLIENKKKSPKIFLLDTGILNYFAGIQSQILTSNYIDDVFEGKVAEHIVGQELLTLKTSPLHKNIFWVKEKKQSNAEIDFIYQFNDLLIPIEVKLGKTGRLRSLMEYIDICPHNYAIRIYSGELKIDRTNTIVGKKFYLLNLPFYLVQSIDIYIKWLINETK